MKQEPGRQQPGILYPLGRGGCQRGEQGNPSPIGEADWGEDAYIGNHTFKKVERKGPVSYATIVKEHAAHVDLEKYRGEPSVYFQVR